MSAAVECIREVFPLSTVKTVRIENYKSRITIATSAFGSRHVVWTGKQSNLFESTPKRRRKAMNIIKSSLADLKDTLR